MGKMCKWSEVARWERWENSEVAQSERWECNKVAIWEKWEGSEQRRWDGIQGQNCVVSPGKRNVSRNSLQGFHKSYIMFWIIEVTWMMVA